MNDIAENIAQIRDRIDAACSRSGRNKESVHLIAVSKVKPAELVDAAFEAGQKLFGENYVQEFSDKVTQVKKPITWHFIGALQSNKVKYIKGKVAMIHSVDRLSLATEINKQWSKLDSSIDILIQINIGNEESKSGCRPADLETLIREAAKLPYINIKGLMCLPPHDDDPERVRPYFTRMKQLSEQIAQLNIPGVTMDELSMGMSGDFEVAIEEGATLVRVGTAIFGARKKIN